MTKLNHFFGCALAIAIVAQASSSLFAQATVNIKVANQSEHPVELKIVEVDLTVSPPTVKQTSLGTVPKGTKNGKAIQPTTKTLSVPKDANISYFQNKKQIGVAQARTGQKIFVRKPGVEFKLTNIHCHIADDEGPDWAGDEIEFHGKIAISVSYNDEKQRQHEIPCNSQTIYVEEMDDNSSRPLSNTWTVAVPGDFLANAQVKTIWSETWEEDNASSSKDDILQVDGGDVKIFKNIESEGPFKSSFRIRNDAKDADVEVYYECKTIETFEAN